MMESRARFRNPDSVGRWWGMTSRALPLAILVWLPLVISLCGGTEEGLPARMLLDRAARQYAISKASLDPVDGYPRAAGRDGRWSLSRPESWTSGFYAGTLWYLYEHTGDGAFSDAARVWTEGLEPQKDANTHDVGFMINNSFGHGYRLTGQAHYGQVVLEAADTLAMRYNPVVGATQSWDWPSEYRFPVIIDNMMNLELLFWASENGGDASFHDIAVSHAMTTIRDHLRSDGSAYHVVDYDPGTGEVLSKTTRQGYADESAWARGQAWGLYGFTVAYRETGTEEFLDAATRMADFFVAHLPDDCVPFWDFSAPDIPDVPRDASAAAIAASGLLELAQYASGVERSTEYRRVAEDILISLSQPTYLRSQIDGGPLLLHSTGSYPAVHEVDVSLVYADYYYVEALMRREEWSETATDASQLETRRVDITRCEVHS